MPEYYKDCIEILHQLKMKQTEECIDFIWYNYFWKIGNETVYCDNLFKCGIWTIHDLYNNDGSVIPFDTWVSRGVDKKHYILWRGLIGIASKIERSTAEKIDRQINKGFIESDTGKIEIDSVSEKQIKIALRKNDYKNLKHCNFKSIIKYETIHGKIDTVEWKDIYTLPRLCRVDNSTKDVQYKILHRFLPTQFLLFKMKKINSPVCLYCYMSVDKLEHALFECHKIRSFWFEVFDAWNVLNDCSINIDLGMVTFGYFTGDDKNIAVNSLLMLGKKYIFSQKLKNCVISLQDFKRFIGNNLDVKDGSDPITNILLEYTL